MPDFSTFLNTPTTRAIVQEGLLERAFHDVLFPNLIFRGEVSAVPWPAEAGDTYVFSGDGLMAPDARPIRPGEDPTPQSYAVEQWEAELHTYGSAIDTHMPTATMAIANLFLQNIRKLGLQAAQTLNIIVRDRMYNTAESGWTVADGAASGGSSASLRVKRLNGFTRARRPDLAAGSKVRFNTVSSSNPLAITVGGTAASVVGFTPDTAGDEVGPGILTLAVAMNWSDRAAVLASDRSEVSFVGGGTSVNDIGSTDLPRLQDIRTVVSKLQINNVPRFQDGTYHVHIDPNSQTAILADTEIQRMLTGRPEHYMYRDMVLGMMLGCSFVMNNQCPYVNTVYPNDGTTFSQQDPFAGELYSDGTTSGTPIHRMLFTGRGGMMEYYRDPMMYLTDAGMLGKMTDVQVSNDGISIVAERVKMIILAPQNRFQDLVKASWRLDADWPARTDATAPGTSARYKRWSLLVHGA